MFFIATIQYIIVFSLVSIVSNLHFQSSERFNSTIKDVINAACPHLPTIYITNTQASNWIYGKLQPASFSAINNNLREKNKVVKCSLDRPFSNGEQCINCDRNMVFNLQTKVCQRCVEGSYNKDEKRCQIWIQNETISKNQNYVPLEPGVQYFTDFSNPNLLSNGKPFEQILQDAMWKLNSIPIQSKRVCPPKLAPFFNGTRCIACFEDKPYFDLQRKSCINCQRGLVFSSKKHKCHILPIRYLTSPNSTKILFTTQSQQNYRMRFQVDKNQYPICPSITPYFNGQRCISCNSQTPIFDIFKEQCTNCPPTKVFDEQKKKCVQRLDVFPTLERYLMNIK